MDNLKKVYEEYMTQVYRYLFSLSHDPHLAEELTQETFFQVLKSIDQFRGDCKLYVWLCQVAKHVWIKEMKRRGKVEEMVKKTVKAEDEHEELPENRVISKESVMDIYKSIHMLREPMREVMYLRLSGEFSFKEIGTIMGKDENWARVTFYRGKTLLRRGRDEV